MIPTKKRPSRRPSDEELIMMRNTMTIRSIAAKYDVSSTTVNNWLKKLREANKISQKIYHTGSKCPNDETLGELYEAHTAKEIASMYEVAPATVCGWINRARKRQNAIQTE